jgi:hypothetical protein
MMAQQITLARLDDAPVLDKFSDAFFDDPLNDCATSPVVLSGWGFTTRPL